MKLPNDLCRLMYPPDQAPPVRVKTKPYYIVDDMDPSLINAWCSRMAELWGMPRWIFTGESPDLP